MPRRRYYLDVALALVVGAAVVAVCIVLGSYGSTPAAAGTAASLGVLLWRRRQSL